MFVLIVRRIFGKCIVEIEKSDRFSHLDDIEFVLPKGYSKILDPLFSQEFDFYAKSENRVLSSILAPTSQTPNIDSLEKLLRRLRVW